MKLVGITLGQGLSQGQNPLNAGIDLHKVADRGNDLRELSSLPVDLVRILFK